MGCGFVAIKIIVDSTCDLPRELLREHDIRVLPLNILLDGKEYLDGEEIGIEEVYEHMRRGILPKTSQVRTDIMLRLFEEYASQKQDFIYIAFSSKMSGTCGLAESLLKEVSARYPGVRMKVVDSGSGSLATGLIALEAAKEAERDVSFYSLLDSIKFMANHAEHVFAIRDLLWLTKGGRIGKVVGKFGSLLDIRPLLDVRDGEIKLFGAARGKRRTLHTLVEQVAQRIREFPEQTVGVSHAGDPEAAGELVDLLRERLGTANFIVQPIGGVLGAHLGIGGVGVFFFNARPERYMI